MAEDPVYTYAATLPNSMSTPTNNAACIANRASRCCCSSFPNRLLLDHLDIEPFYL